MNARLGFIGLGLALGLVGCGQGPVSDGGVDTGTDGSIADAGHDAGPTEDAGTPDGGSTDAGQTDAGQPDAGVNTCSGFVPDAPEVAQMFVATMTPVGTGGTIVDGVYDLTEWSVYTGLIGPSGPTGVMVSATQIITGSAYRYNHRMRQDDAGVELDSNGTFTTFDGGVLVGEQLCPPGPQPFTSYTTDGTNLFLYSVNPPWGVALKRR